MKALALVIINVLIGYWIGVLEMAFCSDEKFTDILAKILLFRAKWLCRRQNKDEEE